MTIPEKRQADLRKKLNEMLSDVTIRSIGLQKQTAKCGATQILTGKKTITIEVEDHEISDNFMVDYIRTISGHYSADPMKDSK